MRVTTSRSERRFGRRAARALTGVAMAAMTLSACAEKENMLKLDVSIAATVLTGAPMPARIVLRNTGGAAIDLAALGVPAALELEIRDDAGAVVTMFQGDGTARRLDPLPPGAELVLDLDVQKRLPSALARGRYDLEVAVRDRGQVVASGAARFVVEPLVPEALVRIAAAEGDWLGTLLAHRRADGRRTILYSFSERSNPFPGALRTIVELPPSAAPPMLTAAPRSLAAPAEAWTASLVANELLVGRVAAGPTTATATGVFAPVALPGRLLPGSVVLPDGSFLVAAVDAGGQSLTLVRTERTGASSAMGIVLVPPAPGLANAVTATAIDGADLQVHLWWVEDARSVQRLALVSSGLDRAARSPVLYAATGRIEALLADPPDGVTAPWIHVLDVQIRSATLVRFHSVTGLVVDRARLEPLPAAAGNVQRWLLPSSGVSASGPVLALTDSGGWLFRDGVWAQVPVAPGDARNAELVRYADDIWLSRWSPAMGIEFSRLGPAATPR